MGKLKCSKCSNTYLAKINVNEFLDYPGNLHSLLREVEIDFDIKLYQCIRCKEYVLPPVHYYGTDKNLKDLYSNLLDIVAGKDTKEEALKKDDRYKLIDSTFKDPANHGKFVRQK